MTKRHFIALADAIRPALKSVENAHKEHPLDEFIFGNLDGIEHMVNTLADFCQSQNPRFNRQRWLDYIAGRCGPNGGAVKKQAA